MNIIERAGLAILHRLDPEHAHDLSIRALSSGLVPLPGTPITSNRIRCDIAGLDLPNPVGLAAGYDKNARCVPALMQAGFGFIELGAATPRPQPGNPKPRLFRLSADHAIINRFGFNNDGAAAIAKRLQSRPGGIPVGLNIGANKDSTDRAADFAEVVRIAGESADFLTINVSSPNTEKLRDLQGATALAALVESVQQARDALPGPRRPVFVKIAPDLDPQALADLATVALNARVDGVIATNTTLSRDGLSAPDSGQAGGLSGAPLFDRATAILSDLYVLTNGQIPLIGVGGISSTEQALAKIRAGASIVQIYSALIYHGMSLVPQIVQGIDDYLAKHNMVLPELVGQDHR